MNNYCWLLEVHFSLLDLTFATCRPKVKVPNTQKSQELKFEPIKEFKIKRFKIEFDQMGRGCSKMSFKYGRKLVEIKMILNGINLLILNLNKIWFLKVVL
jgi:hypothetical protein